MIEAIKNKVKKCLDDIRAVRRHIHQHPELSFQEFETSQFLRDKLAAAGAQVNYPIGGEGFEVLVGGKNPGPTILLRADMDALPILEETNLPFKSKVDGRMHACGHDFHSACLYGAILVLLDMQDTLQGTVKCIFQPGEEQLPGGASLMIAAGILFNPKVEKAIAQHVFPELEAGKVGFRSGMYMASCDEVYLTIKGKGGHGAMPHAVHDPVVAMAHIVTGLQSVVSRNCPPAVPCVLSFGKVIANGATNVIPGEVKMEGTFRTLNEEWRADAHQIIQDKAKAIALAHNCVCEIEVRKGYPFLENNPGLTETSKNLAQEYLGKENVVDLPLRMTGEDFAFFSHLVPSCFYRLGTRNEAKGQVHGVHHPEFNPDETALEIGAGLMAYLALKSLEANS